MKDLVKLMEVAIAGLFTMLLGLAVMFIAYGIPTAIVVGVALWVYQLMVGV